jgi:outer membrane protein OmpA-like peptidoglycan-associated protein
VDGHALFSMVGIGVEIPLGNTFALFGEGQYRKYATMDDNLGGAMSHKNDALYAALGLRVKFGANSRNHVRNMKPFTDQDAIDALRRDLRQVEDRVNTTSNNVDNLNRRVNDEARQQQENNAAQQREIDQLRRDLDALQNQQQPVAMSNIEFRFDSSELTAGSMPALEQIARELNANQNWSRLTISGHTDNVGPDAVNQRLSVARAESVKRELVRLGVPANKIETVGAGEANPVASNATLAGRQQNRRVEFQLSR